jgi:hypothetical protein
MGTPVGTPDKPNRFTLQCDEHYTVHVRHHGEAARAVPSDSQHIPEGVLTYQVV